MTLGEFIDKYNQLQGELNESKPKEKWGPVKDHEIIMSFIRKRGYLWDVLSERYQIGTAAILFLDTGDRFTAIFGAEQRKVLSDLGFTDADWEILFKNDELVIALAEERLSKDRFIELCKKNDLQPGQASTSIFSLPLGVLAFVQGLITLEEANSFGPGWIQSWLGPNGDQQEHLDDLRRRKQFLADPERGNRKKAFITNCSYDAAILILDGISLSTANDAYAHHDPVRSFDRFAIASEKNYLTNFINRILSQPMLDWQKNYPIEDKFFCESFNSGIVKALLLDKKIDIHVFLHVQVMSQYSLQAMQSSSCKALIALTHTRSGCRMFTNGCISFSELFNLLIEDPDRLAGLLQDDADLLNKMFDYIANPAQLAETGMQSLEELQQRVKAMPLVALRALLSRHASFKEAELISKNYAALQDLEKAAIATMDVAASTKILTAANPANALAAWQLEKITSAAKQSQPQANPPLPEKRK